MQCNRLLQLFHWSLAIFNPLLCLIYTVNSVLSTIDRKQGPSRARHCLRLQAPRASGTCSQDKGATCNIRPRPLPHSQPWPRQILVKHDQPCVDLPQMPAAPQCRPILPHGWAVACISSLPPPPDFTFLPLALGGNHPIPCLVFI